jgi:hypothetical protein
MDPYIIFFTGWIFGALLTLIAGGLYLNWN